ncbi:hypothetical protein [Salinisphaera sp.]|uniref:hypothetical protein n=1 Tax=Salinisphaera sp. TaxID=1914330 RepID=UPI002D7912BF|nr:hypothetical protein [Salinisphaera sp.]HET7314210.1 hypothetical protein [Salinisphaera sp.]
MIFRSQSAFSRHLPWTALLLGVSLLAGCHIKPRANAAPPLADPGRFCLRHWPNDRDSFLLCQQLQDRNRLEFYNFLSKNGLSERHLAEQAAAGDPVAQAALYCRKHGVPDYQRVWNCTQRHTEAIRQAQ